MQDNNIFIGFDGDGAMNITIPKEVTVNVRADVVEINPKDTTISIKNDSTLDQLVDEIIREEEQE